MGAARITPDDAAISTLVVDAHDDLRTHGPLIGAFEAAGQVAHHDVVRDGTGLQHRHVHLEPKEAKLTDREVRWYFKHDHDG